MVSHLFYKRENVYEFFEKKDLLHDGIACNCHAAGL